jgi:hypothetical protein
MDEQDAREPTDELESVQRRLAALGTAPLPREVAERTEARLRTTTSARRPAIPRRLVLLAATVTFLLGSVGLAAADTLPRPVQQVAHNALAKVGVHVPPGHERYNDPAVCPDGPYRNHGEYVRSHQDDPNAGASPCGKPVRAVNHPDDDESADDVGEPGPPASARGNGKRDDAPGKQDDGTKEPAESDPDDAEQPDTTTASAPTTTATRTTTAPDDATTTTSSDTSATVTSTS